MPITTRVTGITISLAIAACGARSTTTPPRIDPPIAIVDAAVDHAPDAAPPITIITPSKPGVRIEAPHGGMITDLAVTPDGTTAVSSDDLGGHRVWPKLDGSIEPRVIELPSPSQIAIGHDPKGFSIALIDEAGGLVLQQIDRDGLLIKRATLPLEPTYNGLAMTDRGPIAWRADQRIVRLDTDGTIVAQLATEPGQRLLALAVPAVKHAERAVAVVEGATDNTNWRRARWMSIGDKLAWGDWIALGEDLGHVAAVSPSLKRLAVLSGTQAQTRVHVFDLTVEKLLGAEPAGNAIAIAVPDDDHVAYSQLGGRTHWLAIGVPKSTRTILLTQPTGAGLLASGGGRTVNPNGNELAISDATTSSYLGYGIQAVQQATPAERGRLAIAHGDRTALLDDKLRAQPMPLVPTGHNVTLMRWLGGEEFAVQALRLDTGVTTLSLVDLKTSTRGEWRTNQVAAQLNYEPSTRLLAVSYGPQPEVARYVAGKLRVDSVATYPKPGPYDRVHLWPVSPQRSGGTQVVTAISRDTTTVRWVSDARALDKGVSMILDGSVAAVDATGKVYAWQSTNGKLDLALFRDAKRIGKLEIDPGGRSVWPDAMGERVIVSGNPHLVLFGPDGARVWTRSFPGITHVVWLDDGAVAVVTALGIARLDAKTGETLLKRCGWAFELASKPHAGRARIAPMCTPQ